MKKKLLSMLLCLTLVISLLQSTVFAAVNDLLGNDPQKNTEILSQLSAMSGMDAQQIAAQLEALGLLDENGEIKTDYSISLDGEELTLDEVMELLEDPATNLDRIGYVDGTPIPLKDLKTIIEIEKELARIQETYFSGKPFTGEALSNLNSLMNQLQAEGIQLTSTLNAQTMAASDSISTLDVSNFTMLDFTDGNNTSLSSNSFDISLGQTVSFDVSLIPGYSSREIKNVTVSIVDSNNSKLASTTINVNSWPMKETQTSSLSYEAKSSAQTGAKITVSLQGTGWQSLNGYNTALLELSNPKGILFYSNGAYMDKHSIRLIHYYMEDLSTTETAGRSEHKWTGVSLEQSIKFPNPPSSRLNSLIDRMQNASEIYDRTEETSVHYRFTAEVSQTNNANKATETDTSMNYGASNFRVIIESYDEITGKSLQPGEKYKIDFIGYGSSGAIPVALELFSALNTSVGGPGLEWIIGVLESCTISLIDDETSPNLRSVTTTESTYSPGQCVYIKLQFDEMVKIDKNATITINGKDFKAAEVGLSTSSNSVYLWYPVQFLDSQTITVSILNGITDLFGNPVEINGETVTGASLNTVLMRNAATELDGKYENDTASFTLSLDATEAYQTLYTDYGRGTSPQELPFRVLLYGSDGSEIEAQQFYVADDGVTYQTNPFEIERKQTDVSYTAVLQANEGSRAEPNWVDVPWIKKSITVPKFIPVTEVLVTAESDPSNYTLSLGDTYRPTLTATLKSESGETPTFQGGEWSSSNPEIATIDPNTGAVTLTGTALGAVEFIFTADNGGKTEEVSGKTQTYQVIAGDSIALVIPTGSTAIIARQDEAATVLWSSNAQYFVEDKEFTFQIELFEGNYANEEALARATPILKDTAALDANQYQIGEGILHQLSKDDAAAYTVRVSMPHPHALEDGIRLSAMAWIVVYPWPATARLIQPENLYLTDQTDNIKIPWELEHWTEGSGQNAVLTIHEVAEDNTVVNTITHPVDTATGSYLLSISDVAEGELKHTYQVTLTVDNLGTSAPSSDSFPLYVYNGDILKIVNSQNEEIDHLSFDNTSKVDGSANELPTDTLKIANLRQQLSLMDYISINHEEYNWNAFKDGISWETDNDAVASVNYKQGGLYENIKNFDITSFLPQSTMGISSTSSGHATITATHAATGMSTSIAVDSQTLENRFYLFQVDPAVTTTLEYTDGQGNRRTETTNEDGTLALYEPNGIASDVWLRSKDGDTLYMGTLYQRNLQSGEKDAAKLQLYPMNIFCLREVAKAELTLIKPGGDPLANTDVTIRGGVYKNGYYCETAALGPNVDSMENGGVGQTYQTDANGTVEVYFDVTQFWSSENGETEDTALISTDKIEYIFEISEIAENRYYPLLHTVYTGTSMVDQIRTAEGVVSLEEVAEGEANKPFVAYQVVDYHLDNGKVNNVRNFTGRVGPSSSYKTADLQTIMYLWGEDMKDAPYFDLKMADENGFIPDGQISSNEQYPFASIPVVTNVLTLTEESMTNSGWIKDGKDIGIKTRVTKDSSLVQERTMPFRLIDLSRVPEVSDDENVTNMLVTMKGASIVGASNFGSIGSSSIFKTLTGKLSEINGPVDSSIFKMIISPSEDPSVFKALIWTGYNTIELEDMDYSEKGVALDADFLSAEAEMNVPGVGDLSEMAQGTYNPMETYRQNSSKKQFTGTDLNLQLEGFYEAEIRYNLEKKKWEVYTTSGGFTAGVGAAFNFNVNTTVGPVPVTASFELGGTIQLDFQTAVRYSQQGDDLAWSDPELSAVNDYLTTLRINAYVSAFGGIGFDYSVVALKFGVFGKLTVDNQNKFLSRTYLADESKRQMNGQSVGILGEAGIKFVAKFLFISYEAVLASGSWGATQTFHQYDDIETYWDSATSGLSLMSLQSEAAANGLRVASATAKLQSRDYLTQNTRTWGEEKRGISLFSLDKESGLKNLQKNANPGAYPEISDDGKVLVHIGDRDSKSIYDSRIQYSLLGADGYSVPANIADPADFSGFGDSDADIAGSEDFAAAAWVRMSSRIPEKDAGDEINIEEQNLLMNSSEIVASVYDGSGWISTRLTNNGTPDLAPAVAANGDKAIVFWRSVYSSADDENLLNFKSQDAIVYSYYDGSSWSEAKALYNGTSGNVKALEAAMLPDGTAIAVYTLDKGGNSNTADYETGYSIVKNDGSFLTSMMLTADSNLDENPQVIGANFQEGDDRFIIGWHSVRNNKSDIQLAAISTDGIISNSFPASLAELTNANGAMIGADFRFASLSGDYSNVENLSIIWNENITDESDANGLTISAHSVLKTAKLRSDGNGGYLLSSALELATLPNNTLADQFEAYVSGSNEVKAIIQATKYNNDALVDVGGVYIPSEEILLYTATSSFALDAAEVEKIGVEYQNLRANNWTTILFPIRNTGINDLAGLQIDLGNGETAVFDGTLLPNQSATIPVLHKIGSTIEDVDYMITANGGNVNLYGTVYLDYPDIGISRMEVLKEENGKRTIGITLYNLSDATLAGKDRTVKIDFYTDDLFTEKAAISSQTSDVEVQGNTAIISKEALSRIDQDVFNMEITFDLKDYVETTLQQAEVPETGVYLYADVWTEGKIGDQGEKVRLPEYNRSDNQETVLLTGALAREGEKASLNVEQGTDESGNTVARIVLRNNALQNYTGGKLMAYLLAKDGKILETQQTDISGELLGETEQVDEISFSQAGARVMVQTLTEGEEILTFEGLPITKDKFTLDEEGVYTYTFTLPKEAPESLIITAYSGDGGTVTIQDTDMGTGGSLAVNITGWDQTIQFSVSDKNYTLSLLRSPYAPSGQNTSYTVTFNTQGGSKVESVRVNKNSSLVKPANPTKEGYTFSGWYTDAECTEAYDFTAKVTKNMTLYAKWTEGETETDNPTDPSGSSGSSGTPGSSGSSGTSDPTNPTDPSETEQWENPFLDVKESDWFYGAVAYANKNGLFAGMTENTFAPDETITRGMLVTVLWRLEQQPTVNYLMPFTDIDESAYYGEAIRWAASEKIVNGYSDTEFAPNQNITREEMAAIMNRYADYKAMEIEGQGDLSVFADESTVSAWARENISWAVGTGLISGKDNNILDPKGNTTRAETATILQRFLEK